MFRDLFRHSDAITDLKFRENLEAGGNLNVLFYCIGSVGRSEAVKLYHSFVTPSVTMHGGNKIALVPATTSDKTSDLARRVLWHRCQWSCG